MSMNNDLKQLVREVPDFPKPGINYFDITTLLKNPEGLAATLDRLAALYEGQAVDQVIGIESRGFIFAPSLATRLGAGFVPVRKPGKLPAAVQSREYQLEYGSDELQMHSDAVSPGTRVLIVDDVIATGGTAEAAGELVRDCGGEVVGFGFVIELGFLNGRERLQPTPVASLLKY